MLTPSNEFLPCVDIIPQIWQSVSPGTEQDLQLLRFHVEVVRIGLRQALTDDHGIVQFDTLLEVLQQTNMSVGNPTRQLVPILDRELDVLITDPIELLIGLAFVVKFKKRHEGLEEHSAWRRSIRHSFDDGI